MSSNDLSGSRPGAGLDARAARTVKRSEPVFINGVGLIIEHEQPEPEPLVHLQPKMSKRARARLRRLRRELSASFGESWTISGGAATGT